MKYSIPPKPSVGDTVFNPMKNCWMVWDGINWVENSNIGQMYYGSGNASNITLNDKTHARNNFQVNTPQGPIIANFETGHVEFPETMNISTALFEFWQQFSKVYKPNGDIAKYEEYVAGKIASAKAEATYELVNLIRDKFAGKKIIVTNIDEILGVIDGK